MNKNLIRGEVEELVNKYKHVISNKKDKAYSEEDTINGFILPLFNLLGWNTRDKEEVSSQEHIPGSGRPDYNLKINGITQFYLEAKKLSADLDEERYAFQVINYSWNKGVTYAVLTDFESIKVFNAQRIEKADLMDKLVFEIPHDKYLDDFETLWLLSKDSLKEKALDVYAEKHGKKEKSIAVAGVIKRLNTDLQLCRERLTESFSACNENKRIPKELIDEGVQKLLDRLIFLRVAEDRGVEPNILRNLLREVQLSKESHAPFKVLVSKFRELDKLYNSNLFSEHYFEEWEMWDGALEEVINKLYGKQGYYEYNFKEMPADVLGSVYENYLSHKLTATKIINQTLFNQDGEKILVHKDARKRKEQGIFYTPPFIVDYIVRDALKPILDKCYKVDDLKMIKVLDPACGSGSFLMKALEAISEKYQEFGINSESAKKQIILENIYGVDLDQQAVEIARLNLLINSLNSRELLPKLDKNIKNGNSLISGTDKEMKGLFGKNWPDKKPFNWQEEFPEVFQQGGFDVVIGNPPYIFARGGNFDDKEEQYYSGHYKLKQYQTNTFLLFIEAGFNLLKQNGTFGFIIPNNWLTINSFSKLREFLLKNVGDLKIINATKSVFDQASVDTCLLIFKKSSPTWVEVGEFEVLENPKLSQHIPDDFYKNEFVINLSQTSKNKGVSDFINTVSLGEIAEVKSGIVAYEVGKGIPKQTESMKDNRIYHAQEKKNEEWVKYLDGVDVSRYSLGWSGEYIKYGKNLAASRTHYLFEEERILVRQIPSKPPYCINGVYTDEHYINDRNSNNILRPKEGYDLKYILGVINSKLISDWFVSTFDKFQRKIFPQFKVNELARFPIYRANPKQQKIIADLVDRIIELNKDLKEVPKPSDRSEKIKAEISRVNEKIDTEVHNIYYKV